MPPTQKDFEQKPSKIKKIKVELNKLTDYSEVKKSEEECVSCQG